MGRLEELLHNQAAISRSGLIVILIFGIAYPLVFIFLYLNFGEFAAIFALLPVSLAGWYFGWHIALVAGIAAAINNTILFAILGGAGSLNENLVIGTVFIVLIGTLVGWAGQRIRTLQVEISRRQEAEAQAESLTIAAQALREGVTAVNSNRPLEEILDRILLFLNHVIPYDAANVMLIEDDIGRIFHHRGYNANEKLHLEQRVLPLAQAPNLQEMVAARRSMVISDTRSYSGWIQSKTSPWVQSYVGAPIYTRDKVIGFLNLNSTTSDFYSKDHAERLQVFADQVAIAIHNAQLLRQARQQTERLIILLDTARAAAATLNLERILHLVAEQITRTLQVSSCNLSRWERQMDAIVSWIEFSLVELPIPESPGTVYSLQDYPLTRNVLESGEPITLLVNDPEADPSEVALMRERGIKSLTMMPLATPDRVIGLLELADRERERNLTADEMALCQALLDQAAVFIVNASLFEETRRQTQQLAIINELAREITEASEEIEISALVAQRLHETFRYYNVAIFIADPDQHALVAQANAGTFDDLIQVGKYRQPYGKGIMGQVVHTGKPLIVNDTRGHPIFVELPGMSILSEAALPLMIEQQVIGVLNVDSDQLNAFDESDEALLVTVASQLATALEKARLFAETRRRAEQLEAIRQASLSVTSSLELSRVLKAILGATLGMVPLESVHIFIYDQEQLTFGAVLWSDGRPNTLFSTPRPGGFTYTVAKHGKLIIVPNIQQHYLFVDVPETWHGSLAGFPLKIGTRVVGVMTVSRSEPGAFTANDLQTLRLLADQAAIAIENARLYKQTQEEIDERRRVEDSLRQRNLTLELLAELSRAIAVPLKINPILSSVVRMAGQALDLTSMYLCDWNEETGLSTVLAEYISSEASPLEQLSDLGTVYHLAEDFDDSAEWLLDPSRCDVIHVRDPELSWNERSHMEQYGVQSIITVPLWVNERPIGYLEGWESRRYREFPSHEVELLQAIARQVAMSVNNAMLYESVRKNEEQFRLIFELAPTGMAIVDLDGDFQQANQAFCETIGYEAEELVGLSMTDVSHPEDIDTNLELDRRLISGELPYFSMEKRYLHKDGHVIYAILQVTLVKDDIGEPLHFIGQVVDITQRKKAEDQLRHNAFHDELTNLPNRALFLDHLQRAIGHTTRHGRYAFAVLFLDLDRFKVINDSLGHSVGDELLKIVARRLLSCVRPGDTVARFGGDEFAVLLDGIKHIGEAQLIADQIQYSLSIPTKLDDHELALSGSIGIAINTSKLKKPEDYVRDADTAMYRAKEGGGGRFAIFDDQMHLHAIDRLRLETDLRQAIQQQELVIYYQPVISVAVGRISKVEALLRWTHPDMGPVPPSQFIPLAEETGLINPLGQWLLGTACAQAKVWHDMGHPIRVAVNISVRQFQYQDLPALVEKVLAETKLPPSALELEITESIAMLNDDFSTIPLQKLSRLGVTISIDDFGTGYSSLSRLKSLPIHILKIDRSFITDIMADPNDEAIVTAIITMAHGLQLRVVAEGVETAEQLAFLRNQKCDEAQGYFFSPPATATDIVELLNEYNLGIIHK